MAKSLGIHTDATINVGLMISNGLVGLCGALVAQSNGYADVNMGIGTIVIALASIIIGEVAFGELTLSQRLVAVTLGSIIYRLILLAVLAAGIQCQRPQPDLFNRLGIMHDAAAAGQAIPHSQAVL
jgi:ABC-type uncharacterized transport system, permease component